MNTVLNIFQIILAVLLTALIFLQSNGQSSNRSNLMSAVNFEKRGWEKVMFTFTIIVFSLFLILSIIQTII